MGKADFELYTETLLECDSLEEMDSVMFEASEDLGLSNGDYIRLAMICRDRIDAEGWLG